MFTKGQIARMRASFQTTRRREIGRFSECVHRRTRRANRCADIQIRPNPVRSENLEVIFESDNFGYLVDVRIFDPLGCQVFQQENLNGQHMSINTQSFLPGLYLVLAHCNEGVQAVKFIKE